MMLKGLAIVLLWAWPLHGPPLVVDPLLPVTSLAPIPPPSRSPSLSLLFVGDVLLHQPQHQQALKHPQGHQSLWSDLLPIIQQADIAYANLEGPIAPGTAGLGRTVPDPGMIFDKHVYTSYPMFNYHAFLADDLMYSGFDMVSTANNHALDRGAIGIDRTIEQLNRVQLPFTGTRNQLHQQDWPMRLTIKGWTISFVACTQHINGMVDHHRQVLLCNQEVLDVLVRESQDPLVDAVIVTPHWGDEYQSHPNSYQRQWAQKMADSGASAIIGSHPHVVQPVEWVQSGQRSIPVAFSLGNFVSNQFHRQDTQKELMVHLTLSGTKNGLNVDVQATPLKMVRNNGYQVVVDGDTVPVPSL